MDIQLLMNINKPLIQMKSRIILKTHHLYSALNTRGVFVGHPLTSFEKLRGRQFRWYPFFCKVASLVCNFSKV